MQTLEKVVALAAVEPAAQRISGGAIRTGRAAQAQIDATGEQRLQHLEALGDHQRRMVRQHHATGADAEVFGDRRDLPDHHVGRGARHRSEVMMLGEPVADIAELVDMARQVDAVAQRGRGPGFGGDDGEVEDGKRDHGCKLIAAAERAMGIIVQSGCAPRQFSKSIVGTDDKFLTFTFSLPTT